MTIEQRITAALSVHDIKSEALAGLICETEAAIIQAEQSAEAERKRALDPALSPDPAKARQAMEDARFAVERLRTMLPRLRSKYQQVRGREEYAAWLPRYEAVAAEQAALAQELAELYQPFAGKIRDLLLRIEQHINTLRIVNPAKPSAGSGDDRRLSDQLGAHVLRDLKLPGWDPKSGTAWPPHRPIDFAAMIPVASDARSYTAEWWKVPQERAQAARAQQQREQQQQQQQAAALENYRGPKWWEGEKPDPERAA